MGQPRSKAPLAVVMVLVVGALGVGLWKRAVRPNLFPKNFGTVESNQIYRSGELTPEAMRRVVAEHGIKTVLDFGAHDNDPVAETREQRTCQALGVTRYLMHLEGDSTGNPNYYVQALRLMNDPGRRPILVHCNAGAERTGCAVILYRTIVQGRSIEDAYPESFEYRHNDERNPRLRAMLTEWRDRIGAAFQAGGLIPGAEPVPECRPLNHAPQPPPR